jgi:MFS family permease
VASFQCLATSFWGLVVLRALLGITEAAFGPGVPFYLSLFYKRDELAFRNGLFISAAPLATSFASTLAWIIVKISSNGAISPWRILFLVEGFPSVIAAVFAWIVIPDSPGRARFLTRRQRGIARLRLEGEKPEPQHSQEQQQFNWGEIKKTLADPKAYMAAVSSYFEHISYNTSTNFLFPVYVFQLQRCLQFHAGVSPHYYQRVSLSHTYTQNQSLTPVAWDMTLFMLKRVPHPHILSHLSSSS